VMPCVLLNCLQPGEFLFNHRFVCAAHFAQLSRPSVAPPPPPPPPTRRRCGFPNCKKAGMNQHGEYEYCQRHLTAVLTLDAHVEGQPVRYLVCRKRSIRLCQVGPCNRQGQVRQIDGTRVCKAHDVLLREKHRYIDPDRAADYALDRSTQGLSSRSLICNFVSCNASTNVTRKYHGFFCAEHLPVIDDLRARITMAKCYGNEAMQIPLRYNEIFLRKFLDERHVQYYNELVAKHGYVAPTVHVRNDVIVGLSRGA
jgi:hypothetical protein